MSDIRKEERVFILYAGEDEESEKMVSQITSFMKFIGVNYAEYKDKNTIYEKRISELYEAINNSPKIIFVLSQRYLNNVEYCQKEINMIMKPEVYTNLKDRIHIILTTDMDKIYDINFRKKIKCEANKSVDKYINDYLYNEPLDEQNKIVAYKATSDEFIEDAKDIIVEKNDFISMFFSQMDNIKTYQGKRKIYDSIDELGYHFIIVADTVTQLTQKDIHKSIGENKFDQKYLYSSSEAVHIWKKMIKKPSEIQKKHIMKDEELFDSFLKNVFWKTALSSIDRIVDLGVGTGEKTSKIINSLELSKKPVNVVLVDSSSNMIKESFLTIKEECKDIFASIDGLDGLDADFMNFAHSERCFMQSNAEIDYENRTAFFILGGTLCNVVLKTFIDSLHNVIMKGDYLIVGIHIYDKNKEDSELEKSILETYNLEKLEQIFRSSFKDIDIEMSEFKHDFVDYKEKGKSLKFTAKLRDDDQLLIKPEYTLIESIRYDESYFTKQFTSVNFEQVHISMNNETAYIAFEYKG